MRCAEKEHVTRLPKAGGSARDLPRAQGSGDSITFDLERTGIKDLAF